MEKYENLSVVGEGSYGLVMKCRHRETGQVVAIKKFIETEEDQSVRKMALREIRMLKKLRHENLVNMIEVFRRKRRFYLVFEYMDHTVLDELEEHQQGLGDEVTRSHIFQVLRGIDFCHANHIVHRDVKPENVLVSPLGVIKLCDFGFARLVAASPNETYTDYVATRWYRAPELLVGDTKYGKEVDIWAVGCLFAEMMTGDPLFPGDSDVDQLFQICKLLGRLAPRHLQMVARNPLYKGLRRSGEDGTRALARLFPTWPTLAAAFAAPCLRLEPSARPSAADLLQHPFFTHDRFPERFMPSLRARVQQELQANPLLRKHLGMASAAAAAAAAAVAAAAVRRPTATVAPAPAQQPGAVQAVRRAFAQPTPPAPRWRFDLRPPPDALAAAPASGAGVGAGDADSARGRIAHAPPPAPAPAPQPGHAPAARLVATGTNVRRKLSDTAMELMDALGGSGGGGGGGGLGYASLPPQAAAGDAPVSPAPAPAPAPPPAGHQLLHPSINNLYFNGRDASMFAAKLFEAPKRSPLPLPGHLREPVSMLARAGRRSESQPQPQPAPPPPPAPPAPSTDRWLAPRRLAPPPNGAPAAPAQAAAAAAAAATCPSSRSSRGIGADDFSLPNVPGASGSPNKGGKKKLHPVTSHGTMDPFISPDMTEALQWHSASSSAWPQKRKRTSIELPHLGK